MKSDVQSMSAQWVLKARSSGQVLTRFLEVFFCQPFELFYFLMKILQERVPVHSQVKGCDNANTKL